jgi:SnoaL-like domain
MTDDPTRKSGDATGVPLTASGIADEVRDALDHGDLDHLGALLSQDVHWGPPGSAKPPCRNRAQVLSWYAKGRAAGRRATVTEVEVHGNALLVGLRLAEGHDRWQVLRVGPDGINDIRGYEDRAEAARGLPR